MSRLKHMTAESLNAHLRTALCSESGQVLREWLAVQCCMRAVTPQAREETALTLAMRNAVRDLYINLESRIKETESDVRIEHGPGL